MTPGQPKVFGITQELDIWMLLSLVEIHQQQLERFKSCNMYNIHLGYLGYSGILVISFGQPDLGRQQYHTSS